ncbi:MAG: hypothetical protein NT113_09460 [Hyphomicrobiales bacterium]|nr:hypothetical protein [Hyphomicrobiales bacterium]
MSALAEGQGSWGEWQSGTKLRLYQLRVDLEGEQARLDAFDVFARDMARGGEWSSSLIPDLASVFELISPRPSWSEMWGALTDHLSLFRDYRLGRDLLEPEIEKSPEDLVAELLFQAIDLSSVELSRQVKVATSEIVDWDGGPAVIVALLNRLSIAGGDHVLEAASLAWGLRYVSEVSAWAATESESWSRNDDLAIIRYGMLFANEFERDFEIMSRELPGIYRLVLLPSQESAAQNYDPPSGFSEVSSGMWTEDSFSLTWPLERPLNILERATRFKPSSMRIRAAQLMRDGRGNAEFSREAVSALESKFRRLELRIFHRRLPVSAAFRAARRVAGELASAGELDLGCAPLFLSSSGAPDLETFAFAPVPRPHVIDRPRIPSAYETGDLRNWLDGEGATPFHKATSSDKNIIAAAGSFDRVSMRRDAVEEHLLLYSDIDPDAVDLDEVISALPRLILCDGPTPLYRETAVGGIVSIKSDIAGSIPDRMITVCPILAGQIGLFPTGPNLMSYQDKSGQIQIETVWWRDGGAYRRSSDGVLRGEGFVVTATDVAFARLRPFLGETSRSHLWRRMKSQDAPQDDGAKYRLLDP